MFDNEYQQEVFDAWFDHEEDRMLEEPFDD
jgi:hypothetical protein